MKKNLFFFLISALMLPLAVLGQDPQQPQTLTVFYDEYEPATNMSVPLNGLYGDEGVKCEFIIPFIELDELVDADISSLTFYLAEPTNLQANFTVFVKEVPTLASHPEETADVSELLHKLLKEFIR